MYCIVSHIATFHKVNAAFEVIFDGERKIWKHRNILSISLLWEGNMERSGVGGGKVLEISANKETASEGFLKASYDGEKKWSRSRSTLDCLGTRLVPAHFWRQAQKVCTPHRLFRLGVIQRMEDILVFPVNHVFSILSNVIHSYCLKIPKRNGGICLQPLVMFIPCIREAKKRIDTF